MPTQNALEPTNPITKHHKPQRPRNAAHMETVASDESSEDEDVAENGEEMVDLQNNQANCLHCGELHDNDEAEEYVDEEEYNAELQPPTPDPDQPSATSQSAQTCDILDRNLYLKRIFVMIYIFFNYRLSVSLVSR